MAVTQVYAINLDHKVEEQRMIKGKLMSIYAWMVGLIVFGGKDHKAGLRQVTESAFQKGFSREACQYAWEKVCVLV